MKIVELRAENIKNLKVVEIKPDGTAVILTGKNGAGKSAVLDSIFMALTGKKVEKPIREGEDRAEVIVDLGKYKVKKVWTDKGERLEVMNEDGAKYGSPQAFLNQILGELSFDPLAFKDMKDKDQRELLLKVLGLDFSESDTKRQELYDERTLKNREVKSFEARVASIEKPEEGLPDMEVSIADELRKVGNLQNKQNEHIRFKSEQARIHDEIVEAKQDILACENEIKEIQDKIESMKGNIELNKKQLAEMKEPANITNEQISEARAKIEDIERVNANIREGTKYRDIKKQLNEAILAAKKITEGMDRIDSEKASKVKSCKFPVAGLGVDDETVLLDGIPFSQISTGQQVKVSTAIAMALNPKLKIILVREGSLLDEVGLKEIVEMAKKEDYQMWIEKVDDKGKIGIHIEDGSISAVSGKKLGK